MLDLTETDTEKRTDMGLMDDFGVDMENDVKSNSWDVADGTYDFEVAEAYTQDGSKNNPNTKFVVFKYDLDENGTYSEWTGIGPVEGPVDVKALGRVKDRLLSLGIAAGDLNSVELSDVEGIRGTFTLKTNKAKNGKSYQNIRNLRIEVDDPTDYDDDAPVVKKKDAPAKKAKAAKKSGDDGDENPFA